MLKGYNSQVCRKGYPKCVPAAKAAKMTDSQKKSAVRRKRAKAQGVGGKPTNVRTFAKRKKKWGLQKHLDQYIAHYEEHKPKHHPSHMVQDFENFE